MNEPPPKRLYKYQTFSAHTLTSLKARTLWFGRPSDLNDPYDCAVPLRFAPVTVEGCERLIAADRDPRWHQLRSDPRNVDADGRPTEQLRATVEAAGRAQMAEFSFENYSLRGVSCFSDAPDNTLLWSHYGGGHRGICLELDTESPWLGRLHKVVYSDEIPEIDLVALLLGDRSRLLSGLLTKATCWSYEREWRAIHQAAGTSYCYGIDALTAVYLGAALSPQERDVVAHLVHGTPTRLYEMVRSDSSFGVTPRSVTYQPYAHPPMT